MHGKRKDMAARQVPDPRLVRDAPRHEHHRCGRGVNVPGLPSAGRDEPPGDPRMSIPGIGRLPSARSIDANRFTHEELPGGLGIYGTYRRLVSTRIARAGHAASSAYETDSKKAGNGPGLLPTRLRGWLTRCIGRSAASGWPLRPRRPCCRCGRPRRSPRGRWRRSG